MIGKEDDISKFNNVIADVYESFIAAVYLVYGFEKASEIVLDVLNSKNYLDSNLLNKMVERRKKEINENNIKSNNEEKEKKEETINSDEDYRPLLRSFVGKKTQLQYVEKERTAKNVTVVLLISGRPFSIGNGIGIEKAKKDAAKNAYKILSKKN